MRADQSTINILPTDPHENSIQSIRDLLFPESMPGHYELASAPSFETALFMAQHRNHHIYFASSRIGEHDVIALLPEISENAWKIPAVVRTGSAGSSIDQADAAVRNGVHSITKHKSGGNFLDQRIGFA